MKTIKNLIGFALLWLTILWLVSSRPARCETPSTADRWYVVMIAETPVGAVRETISREPDTTVHVQRMDVVLNRLGTRVAMGSRVELREDPEGWLRSVDQQTEISSQTTHLEAVVEPGVVRILDSAGDGKFGREIAYEGRLLGPSGIHDLVDERLNEIGDTAIYQTFRPELAAVTSVTLELLGRETVTHAGERVATKRLRETLAGTPLETTLWLDANGVLLRSNTVSPFGPMAVVASHEAAARLAMSGGELPGESYAATLAPTQVRIREPRATQRVRLELRHRNPDLGWPEMTSGSQAVVEQSRTRLVLDVTRPGPTGATTYPVASTEQLAPYLEPNAYLQSGDPALRRLAVEIAGESGDALEAGLALERWVAENMSFDMGVVMAPSNEVLADRRGTCTEFAVLLTALARSLGIPSRFVMGFVYAGGIYGGHAWTEILVGESWIPLDGAIVSAGAADAARFAFQWTSLAEGIGALSLGPGVQLYGQIDVAVLEVEYADGAIERYDPEADLFEIDGDRYVNRSLGVQWLRPEGFELADLELTWPETGLARMAGPDGREAELAVRDHHYWIESSEAAREAVGREVPGASVVQSTLRPGALQAIDGRRAALAWTRGTELWMLTVEGPQAAADLERFAAGLRF